LGQESEMAAPQADSNMSMTLPFSRTILGQSVCAASAGIFQVYSGGIVIDTISTRMQGGKTWQKAIFGQPKPSLSALMRNNLFSGHQMMAKGRFPYLFTNLNSYAQAEKVVLWRKREDIDADHNRILDTEEIRLAMRTKTLPEELFCIACSTIAASAVITAVECPKILSQLSKTAPGEKAKTFSAFGVLRSHGIGRLMQGYDACLLREGLFNVALLGSPAISARVRNSVFSPYRDADTAWGSVARAVAGYEMLITSFCLGMMVGFTTNGPDQLKTRIQNGQFHTLAAAIRWQLTAGGGVRALYGQAALYRALYTGHGVLALNFMRTKVERAMDAIIG